jgi:hypothetical protein
LRNWFPAVYKCLNLLIMVCICSCLEWIFLF